MTKLEQVPEQCGLDRPCGAGCDGCYGFKQNMMAELKKGTGRCPNCDGQGPRLEESSHVEVAMARSLYSGLDLTSFSQADYLRKSPRH